MRTLGPGGLFVRIAEERWSAVMSMTALALWLCCLVPVARASDSAIESLEANLYIETFGITTGATVESGFVFMDGIYLDSPYVVTRKGVALYINDTLVERPRRWPIPTPLPGDIDPEMPKSLTRMTSLYDKDLVDYVCRKSAYALKHFDREGEAVFMEQVYRSLPLVKESRLMADAHTLSVTSYFGESQLISLVRPRRKTISSREDVLQALEGMRAHFEGLLKDGDCLFISSSGSRSTLNAQMARSMLPALIPILRSGDAPEVKLMRMREAGLRTAEMDFFSKGLTHFTSSPQIEQRLGIQPPKQ